MENGEIRNIDTVYSVSSEGRFYKNGVEMKGSINTRGYVQVYMYGKKFCLHKLVAQAFIPNPENKPCVDHISTKKTDCSISNLRWATYKENANNPLTIMHYSDAKKGRQFSVATKKKMSQAKSKPVLQYSKDGEFIKEWRSATEVKRELGYAVSSLSNCCNNKPHFRSAYGFIWKYKEIG